jgi:hypothetical protein
MKAAANAVSFAVYAASVAAMYFLSTPERTAPFSENERRQFHVAALSADGGPGRREYLALTLAQLTDAPKRPAVSFLLPEPSVNIPGGDEHHATVLESGPGWQRIEYRYGNGHTSVSRYRATRERIEPLWLRVTFHPGILIWAVLLVFPALIAGASAGWLLRRVGTRNSV